MTQVIDSMKGLLIYLRRFTRLWVKVEKIGWLTLRRRPKR